MLGKKMKRFNTITSIIDTGLITSTVNTGGGRGGVCLYLIEQNLVVQTLVGSSF